MSTSQNGYTVLNSLSDCKYYDIDKASGVKVPLAPSDAGFLVAHALRQFDKRVESLNKTDTHGYNKRKISGSDEWSNHASGTAGDANATEHVQGKTGTFTDDQEYEIRQILDEFDGTLKWGGDFRSVKDEMHFETIGEPKEVNLVARRLKKYNKVSLKRLEAGDRNIEVYMVKRALKKLGYEVGSYNLYFSVALTKALKAYQTHLGIVANGKANEETLDSLGFKVI